MSTDDLVSKLKALSDPTRLQIFEFLRECCCGVSFSEHGDVYCECGCGKTVGEVCCQVLGTERIPSSLSFHLKELRQAGLIRMERKGKYIYCSVIRDAEQELATFFGTKASGFTEAKNEQRMQLRKLPMRS